MGIIPVLCIISVAVTFSMSLPTYEAPRVMHDTAPPDLEAEQDRKRIIGERMHIMMKR
jgi:hypothetical protein